MSIRLDLSREVTVFVPTIGAKTFSNCLRALDTQNVTFRRRVIDHVAPLSAAYQVMLDSCATEYFVQVDEDMVLFPDAVRRLYIEIKHQPENVAVVALPLWDEHLERSIMGIKIYRHSVVQRYPYRDLQSCEMDQVTRMRADGYHTVALWGSGKGADKGELERNDEALQGLHGTEYTPHTAYERYWDLLFKYRRFPWLGWVAELPQKFALRCEGQPTPTSADWWALLGCVAALTADPSKDPGEKNYMTNSTSPGFDEAYCHFPPQDPSEIILYQTSRCNLQCSYCRHTLQPTERVDIDLNLARCALDTFQRTPNICIAGFGEPLLSPNVGQVVEACLARNRRVSLITNGTLLESIKDRIPEYSRIASFNISLNAATAPEYGDINGHEELFDVVVKNARRLAVELPGRVTISFVITQQNHVRIPEYLGLASKMPKVHVALVNILPHASPECNWTDFMGRVLTDNSQDYLMALPTYQKQAKALGVSVACWPTPISAIHNPKKCRSPWQVVGIDGEGWTYGCRRVVQPFPLDGSNILKKGARVWLSPHFVNLRRSLMGLRDLPRPCGGCFGNWM